VNNFTSVKHSRSISNFTKVKSDIFSDFYGKQKSIEEICKYYQIDEPLAWAIILEGKSKNSKSFHFSKIFKKFKQYVKYIKNLKFDPKKES